MSRRQLTQQDQARLRRHLSTNTPQEPLATQTPSTPLPNPAFNQTPHSPPGNLTTINPHTPSTSTATTPSATATPGSPTGIPSASGEVSGEAEQQPSPQPSLPPSPTLREISSLASWTVSTYKPGCGVRELLSPSILQFWQSDGPQPHLLTIHFFKVVGIVRLRIYLDQELDESYTPTRMVFAAGMGEHDLVEFEEWRGEEPSGWVEVDLDGVGGRDSGRGYGEGVGEGLVEGLSGGRDDGRVLRCMCLQIRVLENHQNGKDTHVRGVQVFARDESEKRGLAVVEEDEEGGMKDAALERLEALSGLGDALLEPEWAREMVIR